MGDRSHSGGMIGGLDMESIGFHVSWVGRAAATAQAENDWMKMVATKVLYCFRSIRMKIVALPYFAHHADIRLNVQLNTLPSARKHVTKQVRHKLFSTTILMIILRKRPSDTLFCRTHFSSIVEKDSTSSASSMSVRFQSLLFRKK